MAAKVPSVKLNTGASMPLLGLGTYRSHDDAAVDAVRYALDVGYRHLDCAQFYANEQQVGEGLRDKLADGTVKREDLFIVSKLWNTHHRKELVVPTLKKTLAALDLQYLDLYLIHWPMAYKEGDEFFPKDATGKIVPGTEDYVDTWRAMEECVQLGLTKAIGVSNFNKRQLERIMAASTTVPAVNQVESHPYLTQSKLLDFCTSKGIVITAYSPLGSPGSRDWTLNVPHLTENPKILAIAEKHGKSACQVLIKFQVQRGVVCIPKSTQKERIKSNFEIFDFELSQEEMEALLALDCNGRLVTLPLVAAAIHVLAVNDQAQTDRDSYGVEPGPSRIAGGYPHQSATLGVFGRMELEFGSEMEDKTTSSKSSKKQHGHSKSHKDDRSKSTSNNSTTRSTSSNATLPPVENKTSYMVLIVCALCCGLLNMLHTSTLFENDRHFSHLSDLEREMTFRTEMGFYYWHYKTLVEADTLLNGLASLVHNNITEYPSVINSLHRFNVMPEVVMAALYKSFRGLSRWAQLDLEQCYKVTRGPRLPPVWSCDGLGVPANFYVMCAWVMAGFTASLVFLSGALLSRNLTGGVIAALFFFFNHGEATRVMWAPPLRETFSFPFSLLVNLIVTQTLRKPRAHYIQALWIAVATYCYLVSWQFSQYTLMITVMLVYFFHTIELIRPLPMLLVLMGSMFGFANCLVSMFANRMLMTSHLAGCLVAIFLMYVALENVFNWIPSPMNKSIQTVFIILSTIAAKMELSNFLGMEEDSHVFNILKSKFSNYSDFHTLLYTCSSEFDFIPRSTIAKLSNSFLLPTAFLIVGAVGRHLFKTCTSNLKQSLKNQTDILPYVWKGIDPGVIYNIIMLIVYCVLATFIMRLKLFMTPQLCIVASLVTTELYFKVLHKKHLYYCALALLLALMSVPGYKNIMEQRATHGEYLNTDLEELLHWVQTETAPNSVFGGSMPTMANLMLSTGRPIVNHPHYETKEIRRRTKIIYSVFSRQSPDTVYEALLQLRVNYIVLDEVQCFRRSRKGCGMVDLWDVEEPNNKNKPALCPKLYNESPAPFHRVFVNDGFAVLQVPSKFVQIKTPKTLQS
ncbi:Dpy-19/Dpy-19-like [Trinorchestia longiramus]|nr:Dpy-19/Dpy-19-like [Trinorchestia longiramus]